MTANMQLRNGKIVSSEIKNSYILDMDCQDYISQIAWSESSYNWLQGLEPFMCVNSLSTWQQVYNFMNYNVNNAEVWCTIDPFVKRNTNAAWFINSVYETCESFREQALTILERPLTRQQSLFLQENNGFLRGILRLGTEIRIHWALTKGHITD